MVVHTPAVAHEMKVDHAELIIDVSFSSHFFFSPLFVFY